MKNNLRISFLVFFEKAADSPILKLLNSDEIELLVRKLPQELIQEHFSHDSLMIEKDYGKITCDSRY